ncbi:WD40-repeat-containing domain protein [Jimgerdemannia flammicorona]|uniref:WD40-repeat-containing domain protein n=1 Tax=Jimgerdemannia flammicorona TaxID=994334 RepID=A0A433QV96_9FUNG|nr:WD40-repeat-containing domain protein [Jimgerdemannia flammicorona]
MALSSPQDYQTDLLQKFEQRDRREHVFTMFIDAHNRIVQQNIALTQQNEILENTARAMKEDNEKLNTEISLAREQGTPLNQQRTAELESQIQNLKEELSDLYRTQSQNAQRLVDMNEELRKREEREKRHLEEIQSLTENSKVLTDQNEAQAVLLQTKSNTIQSVGTPLIFRPVGSKQLLHDELATVQLELLKTEERMKELEKENGQLLQRWLKKMNEEVEKVNQANTIYESAMEQARTTEQMVFRGAGANPVDAARRQNSKADIYSPLVVLPTTAPKRLTAHDSEIHTIQVSTSGNLFATGSSDKKVKVFDARTGTLLSTATVYVHFSAHCNPTQTLTGSLLSIMCVAFNAKDDMVLGASNDNATRLWDLATGRLRHTLTGHIGKVYTARFNGDSTKVVSYILMEYLLRYREVTIEQSKYGICRKDIVSTRTMFSFSSCNDLCLVDEAGSTIASGHLDNNLRLWDVRTGNAIKELTGIHLGQITSLSVSPVHSYATYLSTFWLPITDGSKILTNSRDNTLKLIDLRMYEVVSTFQADGYKNGSNWSRACFSPDGQYVSAGSADGTLFFWNTTTSLVEKSVKEHMNAICGVSWSPNGSQIFSADKDRVVCMWGSSSGST